MLGISRYREGEGGSGVRNAPRSQTGSSAGSKESLKRSGSGDDRNFNRETMAPLGSMTVERPVDLGKQDARLVHRLGAVNPLRPPSPFLHPSNDSYQTPFACSNWPFHSFVFRLSEVAMAVRYILGVPTTALVVVGLCTSALAEHFQQPPGAGMSIANIGHLTCRYALPRRRRSFQCTIITRFQSDRYFSASFLLT